MTQNFQRYVAGFLFSKEGDYVALVLKNRPAWQSGYLNGVGGKVEGDETTHAAIQREFREEAGLDIPYGDVEGNWREGPVLRGKTWAVHFFIAFSDDVYKVKTMTDEAIQICPTNWAFPSHVLPNLQWLIRMCLDPNVIKENLVIDYDATELKGKA